MDTLSVTTQPSSRKDTARQGKESFQYAALWAMYAAYATVVLMPIAALISLYEWARHRNMPFTPYEPRLLDIFIMAWEFSSRWSPSSGISIGLRSASWPSSSTNRRRWQSSADRTLLRNVYLARCRSGLLVRQPFGPCLAVFGEVRA